jgi:hypothetical protein
MHDGRNLEPGQCTVDRLDGDALGRVAMVKGPGRVIFALRVVLRRRNTMSATSTGLRRRMRPTTRGTATLRPLRLVITPGLSLSIPSSAVAKRLE